MRNSLKRLRKKRSERRERRERRGRRRGWLGGSARINPTDSGGWRTSLNSTGGVVGGLAGFAELLILIIAL
jgi:hypothetical protein